MTPGRPAAASPASRTRPAWPSSVSRSSSLAWRAISASVASRGLPSLARASTRRMALSETLMAAPYVVAVSSRASGVGGESHRHRAERHARPHPRPAAQLVTRRDVRPVADDRTVQHRAAVLRGALADDAAGDHGAGADGRAVEQHAAGHGGAVTHGGARADRGAAADRGAGSDGGPGSTSRGPGMGTAGEASRPS